MHCIIHLEFSFLVLTTALLAVSGESMVPCALAVYTCLVRPLIADMGLSRLLMQTFASFFGRGWPA
jgi:hypothetical protein